MSKKLPLLREYGLECTADDFVFNRPKDFKRYDTAVISACRMSKGIQACLRLKNYDLLGELLILARTGFTDTQYTDFIRNCTSLTIGEALQHRENYKRRVDIGASITPKELWPAMLNHICQARGYKPGFAFYVHKSRWGESPKPTRGTLPPAMDVIAATQAYRLKYLMENPRTINHADNAPPIKTDEKIFNADDDAKRNRKHFKGASFGPASEPRAVD